jgi:hypothetical protein
MSTAAGDTIIPIAQRTFEEMDLIVLVKMDGTFKLLKDREGNPGDLIGAGELLDLFARRARALILNEGQWPGGRADR